MSELIPHFPVDQIFEARDRMHAAIEQINTLYGEATDGLNTAVQNARDVEPDAKGEYTGRAVRVPALAFGDSGSIRFEGDPKDAARAIKQVDDSLWNYVLRHPQINNMLSPKKRAELDRQMRNNALPAFERATLESTLESIALNADSMLDESILECWKRLSRRHKTNAQTRFTERMIVEYALQSWDPGYLDHGSSIYDLDRVCRTLRNIPTSDTYWGRLDVGQWNERPSTPFKIKPHKVGTVHVQFTDLDILKELNDRLSRMATH